MGVLSLLLLAASFTAGTAFMPSIKEHVLPEALLREVVERMGRELEGYLDEPAYPQLRSTDYQENPSLRDQEYLQHSSIWTGAFSNSGEGSENTKENHQDSLPAYCDPPNPCPLGYTGEEGCLEEFENTATFSREYQAGQDCMCDSEHMFDCSANQNNGDISRNDLDRLVHQFHVEEGHKNLVAKKFQMKKWMGDENPYLEGERLPVAAKKGINIFN